ncbi:MAG: hypothetical protein QM539_08010 [Alphaproteobacteria bacterium]|nr:hypothetical protein [Alphaproteobacteria bacterium]
MATEVKVNKNRYKLVTLLYLTSVCLSVINIPTSLLDSSYYTFQYFERKEKLENNNAAILSKFIVEKKDEVAQVDTAVGYLKLVDLINETLKFYIQVDQQLQDQIKLEKKDLYEEVANTGMLDKIFKKNDNAIVLAKKIAELYDGLSKSPYNLSKNFKTEFPVGEPKEGFHWVPSHSGKLIKWNYFFFEHKPAIISYIQIKRMIVLLLEEKNKYYRNVLYQLNYIDDITDQDKKKNESIQQQQTPEQKQEQEESQSVITPPLVSDQQIIEPNKKASTEIKKDDYDDFFKKLFESLHAEYFYVGISNKILTNFDYAIDKDFAIEVTPFAPVSRTDNTYSVYFSRSDRYTIRFYDTRNNNKKLLFEKKVLASLLPSPTIRLRTNIIERNGVSKIDLVVANGLTGNGNIPGLELFPGRIVSYQVTRINLKGERIVVNNIGETFQPQTKELIKNSERGDLIYFSNVLVNLQDGTSHTANSLAYKIN